MGEHLCYSIRFVMKIFSYFTPSHTNLFCNYFCPTLPPEFTLYAMRGKQNGPATFGKRNWGMSTRPKVRFWKSGIFSCSDGEVAVFSDVDVIFFGLKPKRIEELLGKSDLIAQEDKRGMLCSGFFAVRVNDKTRKLISQMADTSYFYENNKKEKTTDQLAINHLKASVGWKLFPKNEVFCLGPHEGLPDQDWNNPKNPKIELLKKHVSKLVKVFHANSCIPMANKLALIELVMRFRKESLLAAIHM